MADEDGMIDIAGLVAEHHEAVYRYAYRLSDSVPDAEDLTQQVFLVAQERLDQLRTPECARSWLLAILRNRFLRTVRQQQPVPATTVGLELDGLPCEVEAAEAVDRERLQEALNELPAEFRVVLGMFYFEECSYREIAEQLQVPMGTVMSRLARAKRHLRARLMPGEPVGQSPARE
jgi:RNA polymerase sigma-70 factor (ECF subfamily)